MAHAEEELKIQMEGLATKQAALEHWMELSALHANAEQLDAKAAAAQADMVISAEAALTAAEAEVPRAHTSFLPFIGSYLRARGLLTVHGHFASHLTRGARGEKEMD